jgi:hypothetical protein
MKNKLLFSILAMIFSLNLFSQGAPGYAWVRNSTNGPYVSYTSVAVDKANHYIYCAGSFDAGYIDFGTGHQYNASIGSKDIFLVKYDESGNVIWAKSFGGLRDDVAMGIACDNAGNIFVCGYYNSDTLTLAGTTLTDTSSTQLDYSFVAKFDGSGTALWLKGQHSNGGFSHANAVTTDANNNAYITGEFILNVHCGTFTGTSSFGGLFAAKYSPAGTETWLNNSSVNYAGAGGMANGESIAVDKNFNCIVSGSYTDTARFSNIPSVSQSNTAFVDRIVCKLDSNGIFVWAKGDGVWQGADDNESVAADDTGNIYLSGYVAVPTNGPNNSNYRSQYFLQKLDNNGTQVWLVMGDSTTGIFHPIFSDAAGNTYMAINILDTTSIPPFTVSPKNYFGLTGTVMGVVKYLSNGMADWVKPMTGGSFLPPNAVAHGIAPDGFGNIFITGSVQDSCFFDAHLAVGDLSSPDFYLAKLGNNGATDVTAIQNNDEQILIYPNPSSGEFHFHFSEISSAEIYLYDLTGNLIADIKGENTQDVLLNAQTISAGAYLCKIVSHTLHENAPVISSRLLVIGK